MLATVCGICFWESRVTREYEKGKSLEDLVCTIESVLSDNKNTVIESPKYILDKLTGKPREHDVVLTIKESHHEILVAIECKDRARPIGVPDVEGFYQKCVDTNIDQGVLVSTSGFYETAKKKASLLGIKCLMLSEIEDTNWLANDAIATFRTRTVTDISLSFDYSDNRPSEESLRESELFEHVLVYSPSRKELTEQDFKKIVEELDDEYFPLLSTERL